MNEQNENAVPPQEGATETWGTGPNATTLPTQYSSLVRVCVEIKDKFGVHFARQVKRHFNVALMSRFQDDQVVPGLKVAEAFQNWLTETEGRGELNPDEAFRQFQNSDRWPLTDAVDAAQSAGLTTAKQIFLDGGGTDEEWDRMQAELKAETSHLLGTEENASRLDTLRDVLREMNTIAHVLDERLLTPLKAYFGVSNVNDIARLRRSQQDDMSKVVSAFYNWLTMEATSVDMDPDATFQAFQNSDRWPLTIVAAPPHTSDVMETFNEEMKLADHSDELQQEEALRAEFEQSYVDHFNTKNPGKTLTMEDMLTMRDGDSYGDRAYLNGMWEGFKAARATQPIVFEAKTEDLESYLGQAHADLLESTREMINNATAAVMGIAGVTRIDITEQALADVDAKYSVEMTPHEDGKGYTLELIQKQ